MAQGIYLNGKFKKNDNLLTVLNPYTQEEVDKVCLASKEDVEEAMIAAEKALRNSKNILTYQRVQALEFIAQELSNDKERLAKILAMEGGKPIDQAKIEIDRGVSTFKLAAQHIASTNDEVLPLDVTSIAGNRFGIVKRFPAGIVYGISPFNFPLNLVSHKVAPALASGCPIILKPASATPLTAIELAKIFDKTDLPKGFFQVLTMDREVGDLLVEDERVNILSFTGSPKVGWKMKNRAGKKKVVLELGGDAALYVHKDANLEEASEKAVVGAFANAGQVCISVQRLIIHQDIYHDLMALVLDKVKKIKVGDILESGTLMGPLIDLKNRDRILSWIDEAKQAGVKILHGGELVSETVVAPTILENTPKGMKVSEEEAFGPVLNVYKVANEKEAFDKINDSVFGLQCGILTNDNQVIFDAFEEVHTAGIVVNDFPSFRVDNMPYGGIKDSGFGREGIKYAIEDMTELKVLVVNRNFRYS